MDWKSTALEELDMLKLEDGIKIHESTKVDLDIYSRTNKVKLVKPFVLVVAKDSDRLDNIIVNELINIPEVDYNSCAKLLFKLARQVLDKFATYLSKEDIKNTKCKQAA